jgi:hypothetical protein
MGMFDTIHFEKPIACASCQAEISSIQTKAFDSALDDFRIGDCVGHAEELRIVRESLYCNACRTVDRQWLYLVVYRGILADIALDLATAETQLRTFSFERLLLWYHDLYANREHERRERCEAERFLHEVVRWYEEGHDQMSQEERRKHWPFFLLHGSLFENAASPVAAIRAYLDERKASEKAEPSDGITDSLEP